MNKNTLYRPRPQATVRGVATQPQETNDKRHIRDQTPAQINPNQTTQRPSSQTEIRSACEVRFDWNLQKSIERSRSNQHTELRPDEIFTSNHLLSGSNTKQRSDEDQIDTCSLRFVSNWITSHEISIFTLHTHCLTFYSDPGKKRRWRCSAIWLQVMCDPQRSQLFELNLFEGCHEGIIQTTKENENKIRERERERSL